MAWMRKGWRRFRWVAIGLLGLLGIEILLLRHPWILFRYSVTSQGLTLRSDRPFDPQAGARILAEVRRRLELSPLGHPAFTADVCIANTAWRRRIAFFHNFRAIGESYPFTPNVFLSGAWVEQDTVVAQEGFEVGAHFSLVHTIGHELGHVQNYRHFGRIKTLTHLPPWIREGFAEYVGGIPDFEFERDRRAFLCGDALMGPPRPGAPPYRRLYLLIAFLLEKRGWSVDRLFLECPDQSQVERWLRESA